MRVYATYIKSPEQNEHQLVRSMYENGRASSTKRYVKFLSSARDKYKFALLNFPPYRHAFILFGLGRKSCTSLCSRQPCDECI